MKSGTDREAYRRQRRWLFVTGPSAMYGYEHLLSMGLKFRGHWYVLRLIKESY